MNTINILGEPWGSLLTRTTTTLVFAQMVFALDDVGVKIEIAMCMAGSIGVLLLTWTARSAEQAKRPAYEAKLARYQRVSAMLIVLLGLIFITISVLD